MSPDLLATAVGSAGALLTLCIYLMRSPIRLRRMAILTNACFIVYALLQHVIPTLLLHVVLLPLNAFRLYELQKMRRDITRALDGALSPHWLAEFMTRRTYRSGDVVFAAGDQAREMYYLESGTVRLVEIGIDLDVHQLFGEIAFFSPAKQRMATAVCVGDVTLRSLTHEQLLHLYQREPTFGLYLVQLITTRLFADMEHAREAAATELAGARATALAAD